MNGYDLSRQWFDFAFENPEKVSPTHAALYFFCIEHCNRLGWKENFGLPTSMAKEAIGIRNFRTYQNALDDLIEWGFIILVEKCKNQHSSNIIAIAKNTKTSAKTTTKALDKAMHKHAQKQSIRIDSIDKQETLEQETLEQANFIHIDDEKVLSVYDFLNNNFTLQVANWQKLNPHANFKLACEVFLLENAFKSYTTDHFRSAFNKFWKELDKNNKGKLNGSANHNWEYGKGIAGHYKFQTIDGKMTNQTPCTLQEYLESKNEIRSIPEAS